MNQKSQDLLSQGRFREFATMRTPQLTFRKSRRDKAIEARETILDLFSEVTTVKASRSTRLG